MAKIDIDNLPTEASITKFNMLRGLLASVYNEMKELSKKKPDEKLNEFKVNSINRILKQIKDILSNEPTNEFLDLLDSDFLPSNSDSILIIGQYNAAVSQFKSKYLIQIDLYNSQWNTKENPIKG